MTSKYRRGNNMQYDYIHDYTDTAVHLLLPIHFVHRWDKTIDFYTPMPTCKLLRVCIYIAVYTVSEYISYQLVGLVYY